MKVLHNHLCSLCNTTKTCFVFTDFEALFSCCKECSEELEQNLSFAEECEDNCSLCGAYKKVKSVEFEDSLFFSDFKICNRCNLHLKLLIESQEEVE
ncbi:MAG: hypothetical protein PHU51_02135 [Candidatus Nanoarchaeia archaeon]|nr:hypothetical protein [Candidatus Nanoarchaeia archaeon]